MTTGTATMPFPVRLRNPIKIDAYLLGISLTLLLGGLIVLASASISTADNMLPAILFTTSAGRLSRLLLAVSPGSSVCSCP